VLKYQLRRAVESRELIVNLTLRELRTKYRRSFLGWTWSLLNPLATVGLYSFVFGTLFGSVAPTGEPSGLTAFGLYLLVGVIPWGFFSTVTNMSTGVILGNSGLVRKVAFPRQALVISQVLFMLVQFSIELTLVSTILLIAGSPLIPWLPFVVLLAVLLAIFATGIGLALSAATVYFRDLPYLWTIVIQIWFFLTPIVYDFESVKEKIGGVAETIIRWNPMTGFVRAFRHCLFDGTHPDFAVLGGLTMTSLISLVCGTLIFIRFNRRLAEEA
jgi:lipopolysaccharide transport system permease protein